MAEAFRLSPMQRMLVVLRTMANGELPPFHGANEVTPHPTTWAEPDVLAPARAEEARPRA